MKSIRLYLVSSRSSAEEVIAALKVASDTLLANNGVLQTRPGDRPEKDDPNQCAWAMPIEIYDEDDDSFLLFRQYLENLAKEGIIETTTFRRLKRFRPQI